MDRHHNRELNVPTAQGELPVPPEDGFVVPPDDNTIDVLEEERGIDVERV